MIENLFQTLFYEIGRYIEKMRFDFAIRSVVTRNGSLFFISGTNQVIHFHVNQDRQVNFVSELLIRVANPLVETTNFSGLVVQWQPLKKTSGAKILIATKISGLVVLVAVHKFSHIWLLRIPPSFQNFQFMC